MRSVQMLCAGEFGALAREFGYAVALGREPSVAILADLHACLGELGASGLAGDAEPHIEVKYVGGDQGLVAVVECSLLASNGHRLLVEVVATKQGDGMHVSLEQISAIA